MNDRQDTGRNRLPGLFGECLLEHAFDEIFLFDAEDLHFVQVSKGALQNLGYTAQEIKRLTPLDLKTDITESRFQHWLRALREGRQDSIGFQTLHRRKDGSFYPTEGRLQLLSEHQPPLFLAIVRDIFARKQANDALIKNQTLLADAQHLRHIGSCEIDLLNKILNWSEETYRIFEMDSKNKPLGLKALLQRVHPDDRTWLARLIEAQSVHDVVFRLKMTDGRIKYVRQYCEPRCDERGRITRMMCTIQDITQTHLAELARQKRNRLLEALSACNEAVLRIGDEETLLKRVCEIIVTLAQYRWAWVGFAVQDEEQKITPVAQAGGKEGDLDQLKMRWDESPAGRGPAGTAIRTGHPDCVQRIATDKRFGPWRAAAIKTGDQSVLALPLIKEKKVFGVLTIHALVPDAFDSETIQGLQKLADNLAFGLNAFQMQAAHAQLQRQLQQIQKMDAVGQMAGGIAHDFNNRLSVIFGYLDCLKEHVKGMDAPEKWVEAATVAAEHSAILTRQLLALSRRQEGQKSPTQINEVIQEMDLLIRRALTPEVHVSYQLEDRLWTTEINATQLSDALLNLVMNARRAMPKGGKLVIQTKNTVCDKNHPRHGAEHISGEYIELKVSDTGVGMSKETQRHVFEPFFTTQSGKNNMGLGLSMVHTFITRHRGYIKLSSKPNAGTSFRLFLPRAREAPHKKPQKRFKPVAMPGGKETVLIVDDEAVLLRLTEKCLTSLGYQTHLAYNAHQALQIMCQGEKIDLLFSDVVMPGGMNGFELAQKAVAVQPTLKVLLTSGFDPETVLQNNENRFSGNLIVKPYHRIDLAQRIRTVLDQQA